MIIKNKAALRCGNCKDIISSFSRHDWRACRCEACFIDGGDDYTRIGTVDEEYELLLVDWRVNKKKKTRVATNVRRAREENSR